MKWVWQIEEWPDYKFNVNSYKESDSKFLIQAGKLRGIINHF